MALALTDLQLAILSVLWERGEATVLDLHDALRSERRIAQSTVATLLSRLEDREIVAHREEGRQYVYRALVAEHEVQHSVLKEFASVADRLFRGDVASVVSQLLSVQDADRETLARAREMIDAHERTLSEKPPKRKGRA
jgi:predicted transcriptional regulator